MTTVGWIFMLTSWVIVLAFTIWCYVLILDKSKCKDKDLTC
ncbi:MAG TPA: hypothetical protein VMW66_04020 [Elusimicrobiales bacterium]|nr:hypothetical protein [Elusimicrobiales bacterium]